MKKIGVILAVILGLGLLFNNFYSAKAHGKTKDHYILHRDDGGFSCLHGGTLSCENIEELAGVE